MKQTIQRTVSVLLVLTMLLAVAPLTVFAGTTAVPIALGETKTIEAYNVDSEDDLTYLTFTPADTGIYILYSTSTPYVDPRLSVDYDDGEIGEYAYYDDNSFFPNMMDFFWKAELTGGVEYRFQVQLYDEDPAPVAVTLLKPCVTPHADNDGNFRCDTCFEFILPTNLPTLAIDLPMTVPYQEMGTYIQFVAPEGGRYVFTSSSSGDASVSLFDSEFREFDDDYNSLDGLNFKLSYDMEAGEVCYLLIENSWADTEVSVFLCNNHVDETLNGCCDHCDLFLEVKREIVLWEKVSFPHSKPGTYFKFVPEKTGVYVLKSVLADDLQGMHYAYAILYDEDHIYLQSSDGHEDGTFVLSCELEQGKTYYFRVLDSWDTEQETTVELTLEGEKKPSDLKPNKGASSFSSKTDQNDTTTDGATKQGALSIATIVAIAAGAVALIGIGAAVVVLVTKKGKKGNASDETNE